VALAQRTPLLPGIEQRAFLDIDSLRPLYRAAKRGASFGHAKIASRALGISKEIIPNRLVGMGCGL
jgi:hypothetical protein